MMDSMLKNHIDENYWKRTVIIEVGGNSSFNFNLTDEQKSTLVTKGVDSAKLFITKTYKSDGDMR